MQTTVTSETRNILPTVFHRMPTYQQAKTIIAGKVSSHKEYAKFRLNNPLYRLPSVPQKSYKNQWTSSFDFFGKPKHHASDFMTKYWAEVNAGIRPRPARYKAKQKAVQATPVKITVKDIVKSATTLEQKQTFIELAKELGVYEHCKPAYKVLFTYDELLELSFK